MRKARGELREFIPDCTRLDDAELVLAELATNAVLHSASNGDGEFEVSFELSAGCLRIEVVDQGEPATPLAPPDEAFDPGDEAAFPYGESGRGLLIVAALADKWGAQSAPGHGCWWAELSTEDCGV
ncbi:ATP-binding protein [Actinocrinis puniceicyclus]|uniref:ATP-binding protein n=1 Tax=Actinocrinis puniceicyclus TaxID=977794 RepID=A0A8J7WMR8_9ACTN|nr:ATP-binding protein [Actinocrinis puniceicyclus]